MGFQRITHAERVRSYPDCARLLRVLGATDVLVDGWRAAEARGIEQLVAAPISTLSSSSIESTIRFEGGQLDDSASAALVELVGLGAVQLNIETPTAWLRIWPSLPGQTKIQAAVPVDDVVRGTTARTSFVAGVRYPNLIEHTNVVEACAMFLRLAGPTLAKGAIARGREPSPRALSRFLVATQARVSAALLLPIDVAEALAAKIGGDALDWQGGGVHVRFPSGEITSTLGNDAPPHVRRERQARVTDAFERAKLRKR